MLRELTKKDWMAVLGIPETRVPQALLLWGTRNLKSRYATMREHFTQVLEIGSPNGLLEDVLIGLRGDTCVAYASVYGAPMASEIVHLCGVLGTRLVIQIGTCGGFGEGLSAGDLFVVEEAYCGEGASQYYKTNSQTIAATVTFSDAPENVCHDVRVMRGRIYTTSALFAEGREDIENWARQGFSAVDMETATSFAVAEHFGMDRGSILSVFDNPLGQDHILTTDFEKDERLRTAQRAMVEIAFITIARKINVVSEHGPAADADKLPC
jgi:uridine phosphorylase